MRTDELERLLTEALHEGDALPVDTVAAESRLAHGEMWRVPAARRWSVALVAATFVGVLVAASLVLGGRLDDVERGDPVGPAPRFGLSPSGLPVGTLVGRVDRTEPGVTSTVRLVVRPDGTGIFNAGTRGDEGGDAISDYEVLFAGHGPGRAVMRNRSIAACFATDVLTLHFSVRAHTVRITDISQFLADCIVSRGLVAALPGTILRIEPPPVELSPSGLPVGVLEVPVEVGPPGDLSSGRLRLLVGSDGTGQYKLLEYDPSGADDTVDPFDVILRATGAGQAVMIYHGTTCLTAGFTVVDRTVTFATVRAGECLVSAQTAGELSGRSTDVRPLPESGSLD